MTHWLTLLCDSSATAQSWRACAAADWAVITAQAKQNQLAALLYQRLQTLGLEDTLPSGIWQQLRQSYLSQARYSLMRDAELAAALHALAEAGVRPVVFKGAELAHTVYPTSACRFMGDIDVWLMADDLAKAQAVLERAGYRQHIKETRPPAMQAQRFGEVQLHGAAPTQGLIELHWGVFPGEWLTRTAQVDHAAVWARCVPVSIVGRTARGLSPEDRVLQLAVHQAISHQMSVPYARATVDVVLASRQPPIDWQVLAARARAWHIATPVWLVLSLAHDIAGLTEAEAAIKQLAPPRWRRWLIGRFVNPRSFMAHRPLSTSRLRLIYLLLVVDKPKARLRLMWRTVWPEADWLIRRYGRCDLKVRWRHLAASLVGRI